MDSSNAIAEPSELTVSVADQLTREQFSALFSDSPANVAGGDNATRD
ncbi:MULTISPECIES: hypothetical protein [Actinomycetes]|nr:MULTISPECIES: hypothetical protein [Actinomycetes]